MEDVKLREKIREFLSIDYGYGDGDGYGDGSGSGSGGLSEINGHKVYLVDSVPTILHPSMTMWQGKESVVSYPQV